MSDGPAIRSLGFIFNTETGAIIGHYGRARDIVIPEYINDVKVEYIYDGAFKDSSFLGGRIESVVIPDTVKEIGEVAFALQRNLSSVEFGNSLEYIGRGAFTKCALDYVILPDSLVKIDSDAFSYNNIMHITFPKDSLVHIRRMAFSNNNLTSVHFPESLRKLEAFAFQNNNIRSVTLPPVLERIYPDTNSRNEFATNTFLNNNIRRIELEEIEVFAHRLAHGCSSLLELQRYYWNAGSIPDVYTRNPDGSWYSPKTEKRMEELSNRPPPGTVTIMTEDGPIYDMTTFGS